jgi:hypothetical protein
MKSTLIVAILAFIAIQYSSGASLRAKRQLVPAEFRNINIENYLKNPRSVLFQLKCIVYDGPCDRIGKYLKVTIPELITGTCAHCSPSDRQTAGRLVAHIQKNYPKEWHDAIRKFQGGQSVKPEDASKFEAILGVKIDSDVVSTTTAATPVELPSSTAAPEEVKVEPAPAPAPASVAPAVIPVSSEAPVVVPAIVPSEETKPVETVPVVESSSIVPTDTVMAVSPAV